MPEKEKEEKKKIEQKREETKKPSLWSRIKKPLLTGVMAAGLLITPMKKAEAIPLEVSPPPIHAAKYIEKDKDLKVGWKLLMRYWEGKGTKEDLELAEKIFEIAYRNKGKIEANSLAVSCKVLFAVEGKTYQESKEILLKALSSIDEELIKRKDNLDAMADRISILRTLMRTAYRFYKKDIRYKNYYLERDSQLYKKDAYKFSKELKEYINKVQENMNNTKLYFFPDLVSNETIHNFQEMLEKLKKESEEIVRELDFN